MTAAWKEYQETVASFFRSLGLDALTDVTMTGVRTTHNIDVVVRSRHIGFDVTWLVECKHWKMPVSKLHVLALREIVADIGADRGVLLSEAGFQSGAVEAATLTNVLVTSLADIRVVTRNDIYLMRLHELDSRIESCSDRYWNISKRARIEYGLRPKVGDPGFSGAHVIDVCRDTLSRAFRDLYPFRSEVSPTFNIGHRFPQEFKSPEEVVAAIEPMVAELEERLRAYESSHARWR